MKSVVMFLGILMMGLTAQASYINSTGDAIIDGLSVKFATSKPVDLEMLKGEWECGIRTLKGESIIRFYEFEVRPAGIVTHHTIYSGVSTSQDFIISNDGSLVNTSPYRYLSIFNESFDKDTLILRMTEEGQLIGQRGTNKMFNRGFKVNAFISCEK